MSYPHHPRFLRTAAARLMVERELRGWSVRGTGLKAGLNYNTINRFEAGKRTMYDSVAAYAETLGMSVAPHYPGLGDEVLVTSGQPGAYQEVVAYLEAMRVEAGDSQHGASRRLGRYPEWWKKLFQMTGPILDTINKAASAYGYRLALVPVEEVKDGRSEEADQPGG